MTLEVMAREGLIVEFCMECGQRMEKTEIGERVGHECANTDREQY